MSTSLVVLVVAIAVVVVVVLVIVVVVVVVVVIVVNVAGDVIPRRIHVWFLWNGRFGKQKAKVPFHIVIGGTVSRCRQKGVQLSGQGLFPVGKASNVFFAGGAIHRRCRRVGSVVVFVYVVLVFAFVADL